MKKILLAVMALAMVGTSAHAVDVVHGQVPVKNLELHPADGRMQLAMLLDLSGVKLGRDRQLTVTPVMQNADSTESVVFEPFIVAGHNLYFKHLRDNDMADTVLYRQGKISSVDYRSSADFAPWMEDATLKVNYAIGGCCRSVLERGVDPIAFYRVPHHVYTPVFNYISPVADSVKTRELKKRSYIDFPLDKIEIYPEYRRNPIELVRITNTIDSVRSDKDIVITAITIKGFASPEGRYSHNTWLAQNRTLALKNYVEKLYNFAPDFIKTSYESEDWEGLREYVDKSTLVNRDGILEIIDSDLEPDAKDLKIKRTYPQEYAFLLATVYPGLRHSDYKIDYYIRSFTSIEEILEVLKTDPAKLSLSELYRAAQTMEPGSPDYNEVFEIAVRLYPNDPVANLNAANTAMRRGEFDQARVYMSKCDAEDPTVVYANGVLEALTGNYDDALGFFNRAARLKVADAPAAAESVRKLLENTNDSPLILIQ